MRCVERFADDLSIHFKGSIGGQNRLGDQMPELGDAPAMFRLGVREPFDIVFHAFSGQGRFIDFRILTGALPEGQSVEIDADLGEQGPAARALGSKIDAHGFRKEGVGKMAAF